MFLECPTVKRFECFKNQINYFWYLSVNSGLMANVKKAFTGEVRDLVDPYIDVQFAGQRVCRFVVLVVCEKSIIYSRVKETEITLFRI